MTTALWSSLIAGLTASFAAIVAYLLNRRMQIEAAWRSEKLIYYKQLVDALAVIVGENISDEAHVAFSRASNNLLIIAPPEVLQAHHKYREHISLSNAVLRKHELDETLLANLLNEIRRDLRIPGNRALNASDAQLWAAGKSTQ